MLRTVVWAAVAVAAALQQASRPHRRGAALTRRHASGSTTPVDDSAAAAPDAVKEEEAAVEAGAAPKVRVFVAPERKKDAALLTEEEVVTSGRGTAPNLSESVLADFSKRSARNVEVARLQSTLERSQQRRRQVESVVVEELLALRTQLEGEIATEAGRKESAAELRRQLESALEAKKANCATEERLLVQLQDVAQRSTEAPIKASLEAAIETKAKLVAIELLLIDDVSECVDQVVAEQGEIDRRVVAMTATLEALPTDSEAMRGYSWAEIETLQNFLEEGAVSIAKTDAKVAALRAQINEALDSKDSILGSAPVLTKPKVLLQNNKAGQPRAVELDALNDAELGDALVESVAATAESVARLARSVLAAWGGFQESEAWARASRLLSEAAQSSGTVRKSLADASATLAEAEAKARPVDPDFSAQVAKQAAANIGDTANKLGGALAQTAEGLRLASVEAEVGDAAVGVLNALGTSVSAGSLFTFRAAKKAVARVKVSK